MSRRGLIAAALVVAFLLAAPVAWAYDETGEFPYPGECYWCHAQSGEREGPHGGYTTTGNACAGCHKVHRAETGLLFPAQTLTENCSLCHDGTGGQGVYGALEGRGIAVTAAHRTDTTALVPGGDAVSGGDTSRVFSGSGTTLSCGDCHSPHAEGTVEEFTHDRVREMTDTVGFTSDQLLRRAPRGASVETTEYGSDWCVACHQGRDAGEHNVINHPVDAGLTPGLFVYNSLQVVDGVGSDQTVAGKLGRSNNGYVMPWPRTTGQGTHAPICQQCHEDERNVGDQDSGRIAADEVFSVTTSDGGNTGDNPRFQVFPHESSSTAMLIENGDDLCTNCHPEGQLP